jgi:hypothetical protein
VNPGAPLLDTAPMVSSVTTVQMRQNILSERRKWRRSLRFSRSTAAVASMTFWEDSTWVSCPPPWLRSAAGRYGLSLS